jgi:hypothetical protein
MLVMLLLVQLASKIAGRVNLNDGFMERETYRIIQLRLRGASSRYGDILRRVASLFIHVRISQRVWTRDQKHLRAHPTRNRTTCVDGSDDSDAIAVINGRNDAKAMGGSVVSVRFSQMRIAAEKLEVWPGHAGGGGFLQARKCGACMQCNCGTSYVVTQPKVVTRQFCALRSIAEKLLSSREKNRGPAISWSGYPFSARLCSFTR